MSQNLPKKVSEFTQIFFLGNSQKTATKPVAEHKLEYIIFFEKLHRGKWGYVEHGAK
jgi:hypothetical protein